VDGPEAARVGGLVAVGAGVVGAAVDVADAVGAVAAAASVGAAAAAAGAGAAAFFACHIISHRTRSWNSAFK